MASWRFLVVQLRRYLWSDTPGGVDDSRGRFEEAFGVPTDNMADRNGAVSQQMGSGAPPHEVK